MCSSQQLHSQVLYRLLQPDAGHAAIHVLLPPEPCSHSAAFVGQTIRPGRQCSSVVVLGAGSVNSCCAKAQPNVEAAPVFTTKSRPCESQNARVGNQRWKVPGTRWPRDCNTVGVFLLELLVMSLVTILEKFKIGHDHKCTEEPLPGMSLSKHLPNQCDGEGKYAPDCQLPPQWFVEKLLF